MGVGVQKEVQSVQITWQAVLPGSEHDTCWHKQHLWYQTCSGKVMVKWVSARMWLQNDWLLLPTKTSQFYVSQECWTILCLTSTLSYQIAGFINYIHPFCGDTANLTAFRFYAFNPIMDPWVFIIFRKSVFDHLCSLFTCRFSRGAVKTTAHCALSLPLDSHNQRNPADAQQNNMYSNLPVWPATVQGHQRLRESNSSQTHLLNISRHKDLTGDVSAAGEI